jgi:hypothetical protein
MNRFHRRDTQTVPDQLWMNVAVSVMGPPIVIEAGLFGPE